MAELRNASHGDLFGILSTFCKNFRIIVNEFVYRISYVVCRDLNKIVNLWLSYNQ